MEAGTGVGQPGSPADADERERERGARHPEEVERAAKGEQLDVKAETSALGYILGAKAPLVERIPTKVETDEGLAELTFVVRQMDGKRIDAVEEQHRSSTTGMVDQAAVNVQLVSEACVKLVDSTGFEMDPKSEAFRRATVRKPDGEEEEIVLASPIMALRHHFRYQLGVLVGVGREIRNISGWSMDRVGTAERMLVEASGNS